MKFDPTLYVITDSTYHTTETLLHAVEEACKGGATLIQLREKDTGGRSYLELAEKVKAVTDRYNVPLIIDDRVDVAIACDAAGVHVGASDLPVAVCRKLLGPDKIVGATAKSVEAAKAAYEDGVLKGNIPALDIQYGNVWTNISFETANLMGISVGETYNITIYEDGKAVFKGDIPYVNTYSDVPEGEPLMYFNSLNCLSLALNMGSFANEHGVSYGNSWTIEVRPAK